MTEKVTKIDKIPQKYTFSRITPLIFNQKF